MTLNYNNNCNWGLLIMDHFFRKKTCRKSQKFHVSLSATVLKGVPNSQHKEYTFTVNHHEYKYIFLFL